MKRLTIVLLLLFSHLMLVPALAQDCDTPPTCTPTPLPTDIPTSTATPTATYTPSTTPTPTLDLFVYLTVIPPGGTSEDAHAGALKLEVSAGEAINAVLLFLILLTLLLERIFAARGRR